jgi:hypothetical protein
MHHHDHRRMKGPAKSLHVFLGSVELEVIDGVAFASPAHPRRHHRVAKRGISVLLAVAGVTVVTTGVAAGVMTVTTRPVAHVPAHAHANATAIRVPRLDNDSGTSNPTPSPHGLLDSRPTSSSSSSSSSSSTTSTTSTSSTLPASGVLATAADSRQSASETDSPKTSILVPGRGATVSGSVALAASASSNARSLKFYLLGGSYGYSGRMLCAATLTEAGWACELNTTTVPNGSYSLVSDASNTSGSDFSAGVNITVSNGQSPKTSILVPDRGATVSGSVALAASASSNARSLKFYLLGGSYGYSGRMLCAATLTEAGWACELNTTTVPNGSYSLVSDASNTSGSDFSAGVNITVSNGTALAGSTSTARSATGAVAATPSHADAQSATTAYEAGVAYEAVVAAIHERGGLEGVYVEAADPSGVAAFGAATKTSPTIASDYLPYNDGWTGMDGSGGSLDWMFAQGWTGTGYTLSLGVPIIPSDASGNPVGTLAQGATGAYNSYYVTLAQTLVAAGESNAYLRLGWEFDGSWYAWNATTPSAEASYATYFQQIVTPCARWPAKTSGSSGTPTPTRSPRRATTSPWPTPATRT